jgi:hypothetical protein
MDDQKNIKASQFDSSKKEIIPLPITEGIATPNTPNHEEPRLYIPYETGARQKSIGGYQDPAI